MLIYHTSKRALFLLFTMGIALGVASCSSQKTVSQSNSMTLSFMRHFNQGNQFLSKKHYRKAIETYQKGFHSNLPKSLSALLLYNMGAGFAGLNDCRSAKKYYKKAVFLAPADQQRLRTLALLHLSYAYSCLGDKRKELAALLSAYRRRLSLKSPVATIHIPLRIGATYLKIGNKTEAKKYFLETEKNILSHKLRFKTPKDKNHFIAKNLYEATYLPLWNKNKKKLSTYLDEIYFFQTYLVMAIASNGTEWSKKAQKNLLLYYKKAMDGLSKPASKETRLKTQRSAEAKRFVHNIDRLLLFSKQYLQSSQVKNTLQKLQKYRQKIATQF